MVVKQDSSIDNKIIEMRKNGCYVLTIHNWLIGWDNFKQLDEQVVLCHILNTLNNSNLAVSRNEVRKCFNKNYNKNYHSDKKSYLNWIYKNFQIKDRTRVMTSQVRKKTPLPQTWEGNKPSSSLIPEQTGIGRGNLSETPNSSIETEGRA